MTLRRAPFVVVGLLLLAACTDHAPTTGALIISVAGLPAEAQGNVVVAGPNGFARSVKATTTLEQIEPGSYTVRPLPASHAGATYAAAAQTTHTVVAGQTETAGVQYTLASGAIDLTIAGLPSGIAPNIRLQGPGGFLRNVVNGGVLGELPVGTYTLRADTIITADGDRFGTSAFQQTVTVAASLTPVPVSVPFALVSATLDVKVDGLAAVSSQSPVSIRGPSGFSRSTALSATYRGIQPGTYTITAPNVSGACPTIYTASNAPTALQVTRDVVVGQVASASIAYTSMNAPPEWLNLRIDAANLVQVTQNYAGTVPMIAGRAGLLRVYGLANQCNSVSPKVRVAVGGTTVDLTASASPAPTRVDEASIETSWNYVVPGSLIQPGLTITATIDPDNQVAEHDETDNSITKTIDVRTLPATGIRLVPITFSVSSTTGNVSPANAEQFLALARKLHPVSGYVADVRDPYTTSLPALQAENQNGSWGNLLSELRAVRATDTTLNAAYSRHYYYGVVKAPYTSGVAGIGYIGQPAALGWDHLPTGATVLAHELGHNFGRLHTPCGNPNGIDTQYPSSGFYAGGYIGAFGYDAADSTLKNPGLFTDVMGYCRDVWISDYTYVGMLNWIAAHPTYQASVAAAEQPALLVWGRIVNGRPVLEPAFEISARPQLPAPGLNRLVALDERGDAVFSIPFTADRIADLPGDEASFAFVVPRSMLRGRVLGSLRVVTRGGEATSIPAGDVGADPGISFSRTGPRAVRVRWDAARFPVIMVRGPKGQVLSFARGGDATIASGDAELEVNFSNRVRSARRLIRVR